MKNYKKILTHSILFGSLFVLAAGCQTTSTTTNTSTTTATTTTSKEKTTTDLIGQVLPNFTFETADTQQKTPADFKGKKIVYKRQSKNVQKWEFKNVQFYSLNISFKR